jgi:HK97 family phage major capsid protein
MAYNGSIDRSGAQALMPEQVSHEILGAMADTGYLLSLARRLPNMTRKQTRLPVLGSLPTAAFVTGDNGLKQTTEVAWANRYIDAEELAVIVPIPQAVLDDTDYDVWAEIRPYIVNALNIAITNAVLYGIGIPATWTIDLGAAGLVAFCDAAGSAVSLAAFDDTYGAILGETVAGASDSVFGSIEADGYQPTGCIARPGFKSMLRNTRDALGLPIFAQLAEMTAESPMGGNGIGAAAQTAYQLDGCRCYFPNDGTVPSTVDLIAGQWDQLVYAMRQDITYSMATEGVLSDASGRITNNLFQQDSVALRVVMRIGFALPNPINYQNPTAATRSPFAYLTA